MPRWVTVKRTFLPFALCSKLSSCYFNRTCCWRAPETPSDRHDGSFPGFNWAVLIEDVSAGALACKKSGIVRSVSESLAVEFPVFYEVVHVRNMTHWFYTTRSSTHNDSSNVDKTHDTHPPMHTFISVILTRPKSVQHSFNKLSFTSTDVPPRRSCPTLKTLHLQNSLS